MSPYNSIAQQLFPNAEVKGVEPLVGGVSASVHRLDLVLADGERKSLVIRSHGDTYTGMSAEHEYQLLETLHRRDLPVPRPILVDVSRKLQPDSFLVLDYIEGSTSISPEEEADSVALMADMIFQIHRTSIQDLPPLPMRVDPLPEVFDYIPKSAEWDQLREYLSALSDTAYKGTPRLLHGDFWPENILWSKGDIVGVLDWEDAALGDPLSDVAGCGLELRYRYGIERQQQFTAAYKKYQTVDPNRLALWQVYVASASYHHMGGWGLEQQVEAHMRCQALASIREAGEMLIMGSDHDKLL